MAWTGSGGGIGYNNESLSGDYKSLMADAESVGNPGLTIRLYGLNPGDYLIYTAACMPQGDYWETDITVPGSREGTEAVTGPMPPNRFILGVTHALHYLAYDGTSPIEVDAAMHWPKSYINGVQVLAVPEPLSISSFALSLGAIALMRRKRM